MPHSLSTTKMQPRTFVLMLVVLAMVMRVLYTPVHMAQEEHFEVGGHPVSQAADQGGSDHDHDDDHSPHPALDHATDLIAQRTQDQQVPVDQPALTFAEAWSPLAPMPLSRTTDAEPKRPKAKPRISPRLRGPPAAA